MPLNKCSANSPIQSNLRVTINGVSSPCPAWQPVAFNIQFDGTNGSGGGGNVEIGLKCAGTNQATISYTITSGSCNASGTVTGSVVSTLPFIVTAFIIVPGACCGGLGPTAMLSITITEAVPVPIGVPPRVAPPPVCGCNIGPQAPAFSVEPIRYATGEMQITGTDISTNGFGLTWGHTRSFSSRQSVNETIGNGFNWKVQEWPYLISQADGTAIIQGAPNTSLWFNKSGQNYQGDLGIKQTLTLDNVRQVYRLTEVSGEYTEFDSVTGMFKRRVDLAGNTLEVKATLSNGYNFTQVERSHTAGSETTTEQFLYEYTSFTGDQLLTRITLRRKVNSGDWQNVLRAGYTYYGSNDTYGAESDLKTVVTESWEEGAWATTGTTLYRYYKTYGSSSSSSSSSSSGGITPADFGVRLLKFVVNPASYARLAADPGVTDPTTASDTIVSQYADYYFEYDSSRRVILESVSGASRTYSFSYNVSGFSDGWNRWKYKTIEVLPTGVQNIVYSNYAGKTMLKAIMSGTDYWCDFYKYDSNGFLILHAKPSAVSGFDEQYADLLHEVGGNYQYLRDNAGCIETYGYHSPTGYLASTSIQNGELGTSIKLSERSFASCCTSGSSSSSSSSSSSGVSDLCTYLLSQKTEYPSDTDQSKQLLTTYSYTFYAGTCQVKQKTTTFPIVSTLQNGSGVTDSRKEYFDTYGNVNWLMDERGFITRFIFDIPTSAIVQQIDDVDTVLVSDAPAGWTTPTGGGLHLITDLEHDDQGRMTQSLGPSHEIDISGTATTIRRATWMVYQDATHETWQGSGYTTGSSAYSYTLINPVSITKADANGLVLELIQATRAILSGKLSSTDSFPQSTYVRWSTNQYTECCLAASSRIYHTIPSSGPGTSGTNYDETDFGYDSSKRRNRTVTPGGTITRTVFDVRNRPQKVYVGTDDTGATQSDPTGGGASGNNMVLVTEHQFDGGGVGDGNLTQLKQWVDGSTSRSTLLSYDWRNRRTDTDGEVDFYEKTYYDNFDRTIKTERYNTTGNGILIARSEIKYDDRARVYQTIRYGVNPATGSVGNSLTDNTWYDASGNPLKQLPSGSKLFTKFVYDGLSRRTKKYFGYDLSESLYSQVQNVLGDTILEQSELDYDSASNVIQVTARQRYHNATGTGELTSPSGTQPKARVTYSATWPDAIGRVQARADFGTNGGSPASRPSTIPNRSDTLLVTSSTYNSAQRPCYADKSSGNNYLLGIRCSGPSSEISTELRQHQ